MTNDTPARFPRTSRDDPSRWPDAWDTWSGPTRRPTFYRWHRAIAGATLFLSIVGTILVLAWPV